MLTLTGGGVGCTARFDPWGDPQQPSGPDSPCQTGETVNNRWYRQGRRDQTTGTYQMGARTYDPTKAAWLSADTYRAAAPHANLSVNIDPLTQNRYAYVNGDPLNLIDPDGHGPECDSLSVGFAKRACRKAVDRTKEAAGEVKEAAVETKQAVEEKIERGAEILQEGIEGTAEAVKLVAKRIFDGPTRSTSMAAVDIGQLLLRTRSKVTTSVKSDRCAAITALSFVGTCDREAMDPPRMEPPLDYPGAEEGRDATGLVQPESEGQSSDTVSACPSGVRQIAQLFGYGDFVRAEYYSGFSRAEGSDEKAAKLFGGALFFTALTGKGGEKLAERLAARGGRLGAGAAKGIPYVGLAAFAIDGLCAVTHSYRDAAADSA